MSFHLVGLLGLVLFGFLPQIECDEDLRLPNPWEESRHGVPHLISLGAQRSPFYYYLKHITWAQGKSSGTHFLDSIRAWEPWTAQRADQAYRIYTSHVGHWPAGSAVYCDRETMDCSLGSIGGKITYEITSSYLADRRSPWMLYSLFPHAQHIKFALVLADPVRQALLRFQHLLPNAPISQIESIVRREIEILEGCYSWTLKLGGDRGCVLFTSQIGPLNDCVFQIREETLVPWFYRFTKALHPDLRYPSSKSTKLAIFEGVISRGIYVDHIRNYLCAGFRPDQFLVFSNEEVRQDHIKAMGKIAKAFDKDLKMSDSVRVLPKSSRRGIEKFSPEFVAELRKFYRPYNEELISMLEENNFDFDKRALQDELNIVPLDGFL